MSNAQATIEMLRGLQWRRTGYRLGLLSEPPAFTSDPAWLVNVAINRRAGWPDDPGHHFGSCTPVHGTYPSRAAGDDKETATRRLARHLNAARVTARLADVRCLPKRLCVRLFHRVECPHEPEWVGQRAARCEECLVAWWMGDWKTNTSAEGES